MAELNVVAELADERWVGEGEAVRKRLEDALAANARIRVGVELRAPGSMPRQEVGKAKRVFEQTSDDDPLG